MNDNDKNQAAGKEPLEAEAEELDQVAGGTSGRHETIGRFSAGVSDASGPVGRLSGGSVKASGLKTGFVAGEVDSAELEELDDSSDVGRFQPK